jgi:hypothetical protein
MNLHIFGHSVCRRKIERNVAPTFVDILLEKYNLPESNLHQADAGSEERILYFLKKTPKIDFAVIFHSEPEIVFVPTLERDFFPEEHDGFNWLTDKNLNYYPDRVNDKSNGQRLLADKNEFISAYNQYMKFFHSRDTLRNRFTGSLIQIDQYLTAKKIPAIHCAFQASIPSWFNFTSGEVDYNLIKLQDPHNVSYDTMSNRISPEHNYIIADFLIDRINRLK